MPPAPLVWDAPKPAADNRPVEIVKGQAGVIQSFSSGQERSESVTATSKAAQRWRESWRERQRAEAGPATGVSRGQAVVPEPLLVMQQSFVRMRAIILPKRNKQKQRANMRSWAAIILMGCFILGLGAYIFSTYLPETNTHLATSIASASNTQPSLAISGTPLASIAQGQTFKVHGQHFNIGDPILFILDGNAPVSGMNGRQLTVTTNDQGSFDTTILVPAAWTAGAHILEAEDNRSGQIAYLDISVAVAGTPATTSNLLALSMQGKPITQLTFNGVVGQSRTDGQNVTLKNLTNSPITWTATAISDHNLSWLTIDSDNISNQLDADATDSITINTLLNGLQSSKKPYTGHIIFALNTINGSEQLTLPVELLVTDTPTEIVFSPNPVVGVLSAGGTCQPGSTLTLINLGTSFITWNVNPDVSAQSHIHFNGQPTLQGQLLPGATVDLALTCINVQAGQSYHVTISANGKSWSDLVNIQTTA